MRPERSGIEILVAFFVAALVLLLGMGVHVERRTFIIMATMSGAMIAVIVAGHLVALLADWLRWVMWPWLRERETRKNEERSRASLDR